MPIFPITHAPLFDADKWRLRIGGLVDRNLELPSEEIAHIPHIKIRDDFTCLEGWTVPGITWEGVKVSEILQLAGVNRRAKYAVFIAKDFTLCLPLARCTEPTTILADKMNNAPLTFEHGAPLRLILFGQQCFESVKWIHEIRLTDEFLEGSAKEIALNRIDRLETQATFPQKIQK